MEKKPDLQGLKKNYEVIRKKYNLPSFKELNEEFDVEKVAERETDCLAREIRRIIIDKAADYLRFVEMLVNPTNAPLFFMIIMKGMSADNKKILEELYEKLGMIELEAIGLDCEYGEDKEAAAISKIFEEWRKEIAPAMIKITEILKKNWNRSSASTDRGYFG